ncbi:lipase [Nitzschia inconspicua]|uniref:Lipase n=1 Tax=Nitzschia inconspicua TaxID=303405 RepID=A0A9K3LJE1_9STRA|nr:lipase [Nitzschia inconspicua]
MRNYISQHGSTSAKSPMSHYSTQAVRLLDQCERKLRKILDEMPHRSQSFTKLSKCLVLIDNLLLAYIRNVMESFDIGSDNKRQKEPETSFQAMNIFEAGKDRRRNSAKAGLQNPQDPAHQSQDSRNPFQDNYSTKTAIDTLLFRLIVSLELLLVRLDDANYVILGHRTEKEIPAVVPLTTSRLAPTTLVVVGLCAGTGFFATVTNHRTRTTFKDRRQWMSLGAKIAGIAFLSLRVMNGMARVWMRDKIVRSTIELTEWSSQWKLIHRKTGFTSLSLLRSTSPNNSMPSNRKISDEQLGLDDKSRTLIEHAMKHGRRTYFWRSTGEIRFLMLKRFMDVYYASVGTAISTKQTSALTLPLVTGAAASFYSLTGVNQEALRTAVNDSSRELIKHAWGMVSLPALKTLMLQASRLLKGVAVADRITIYGVPCIILSKDPVPEMAASLPPTSKRRPSSSAALMPLPTIEEMEIQSQQAEANFGKKSFVGRDRDFRQRDIILHLTGGGFFAHTLASDLPFLMEWSTKTGAVVICPEYALLPENHFPVALNQIMAIYAELASGETGNSLGFQVNRICVTGESAGGNLAAAMCVHLSQIHQNRAERPVAEHLKRSERMPDGLMLSCPALNLTTELSLSRFLGDNDPVLPNSLISAISDAYLPPEKGFNKKDVLASPFFAPDSLLQYFPPTLLFTSSNDPLLDDSVVFNERLCALGVKSEVIASRNVPHAYLGLGTAGFPEAVQVQNHAMNWLSERLHS